MLTTEEILRNLKQLEVDHALASMRKPQGRDAFGYGLAAGKVAGIIAAYEMIERIISDNEGAEALKESKL